MSMYKLEYHVAWVSGYTDVLQTNGIRIWTVSGYADVFARRGAKTFTRDMFCAVMWAPRYVCFVQ